MKISRPMLAVAVKDIETLNYPVVCSPKIDGIRCVKVGGKALSRSFKPIPNRFVREWVEANLPDGIDGELMIREATFNEVQSGIMRHEGEPDFYFAAFDFVAGDLNKPFVERLADLEDATFSPEDNPRLELIPQVVIRTPEELLDFEAKCLAAGEEGVMLRDPQGGYKCGRSTLKQGWLLKLKCFVDSEAEILGFEELQTNTNEKETNELGLSKRSSKKEGKVGADTLGLFKVRDVVSGVEFEIGTGLGLTQELRKEIWDNRDDYLGKLVKYKYQPHGVKDKPRAPVWLGFRSEEDMS